MLELFGYMELSVLAMVTGDPAMSKFSYQPWEGISPREDIESASLHALIPAVADKQAP